MSYNEHVEHNNNGDPNSMDMVPRWFEMLKELRNGTISYIQLIKREQIRPPVRPVCRRLGVAKLSDIVSEDILYRAIVQVAQSQSAGGRAAKSEDNESELVLQTSGLGLDTSSIHHGQQEQYSPHRPNGNNGGNNGGGGGGGNNGQNGGNIGGWGNNAYQSQAALQQQQQRSQRHTFDGAIGGGMASQNSYMAATHRMGDQHNQQPLQAKTLYDRQQRSSFNDAPLRQNAYFNDELHGYHTARSEGVIDPYGDREIQGFGQQLFSNRDSGLNNSRDNINYNHPDPPMRPYSTISPQNSLHKPFTSNPNPILNRPHTIGINQNLTPKGGVGGGGLPPNDGNFSPGASPRSPRLGGYQTGGPGGAQGVGLLGGESLGPIGAGVRNPSTGNLPPYNYSNGHVQGQGVHLGQGQVDTRAGASPRSYLTTGNPALYTQKTLIQSQTQSQSQGNEKYYSNGSNGSSQYSLGSPRTTSFMPFGNTGNGNTVGNTNGNSNGNINGNGNSNGNAQRIPDYSLPSEYGTDYSVLQSDDLNTFGEHTQQYSYKPINNDYPPTNVFENIYNHDGLGSVSQLEVDTNMYGYRQTIQQKSWDGI